MKVMLKVGRAMPTPLFLLGILGVCAVSLYAQPEVDWDHLYGQSDDYGQQKNFCWEVIRTAECGYALAGEYIEYDPDREPNLFESVFLVVTDSSGELLWSRRYGAEDSRHQSASALLQTPDGGLLIAGYQSHYAMALKTDDQGEEEWRKVYEAEGAGAFWDLIESGDGNYVLSGIKGGDCWLMKIDEEGEIIWSQTYGSESREAGGEVILTSDGGFATGGAVLLGDGRAWDGMLLKADSDGEKEWLVTFGTELNEVTQHIVQTSDGGYAVAGEMGIGMTSDMLLTRLDSEGGLLWSNTYGDGVDRGQENCFALQYSFLDHGFILAGLGDEDGGNPANLWLVRTDQDGEELWNLLVEGDSYVGFSSVIELPDYSYVAAGTAKRWWVEGEPDVETMILVKTTSDPLVDAPVEIAATDSIINFGEVKIDSVSSGMLAVHNVERRYGDIDSVTVTEGAEVFSCQLDSAVRLFPRDSVMVPIAFHPLADTSYTGLLHIYYGSETVDDTMEIRLSGRGIPPNGISDFILYPSSFNIYPSFPNPFNAQLTIPYAIPFTAPVSLKVYDLEGRLVTTIVNEQQAAGYQRAVWNAQQQPAGVYLIRLNAPGFNPVQKVVLIK